MHSILLWPLGGLAFVGHSTTPGRDLWVALAGPLTHLPQAAVWALVTLFSMAATHHGWFVTFRLWNPADNLWLGLTTFALQARGGVGWDGV